MFEDQMRALEQQQAQELLSIPYDPNSAGGIQHLAVSAPTTPPRVNTVLNGDSQPSPHSARPVDVESLSIAVGSSDKRKSVTYAPSVNLSPELSTGNGNQAFTRAGAKSMPASRRTSASSHDEELAGHLHGLSLIGERPARVSPAPVSASILTRGSRYDDEGARYASTYNAGMMLDEQLDQEMHSSYKIIHLSLLPLIFLSVDAMLNLPTSDEDKYHNYSAKVRPFIHTFSLRVHTTLRNSPLLRQLLIWPISRVKSPQNGLVSPGETGV